MRRVDSIPEELTARFSFRGATVVVVGCGTGATARWLARHGAHVVGVDRLAMVSLAAAAPAEADERYVAGVGQALPLRARSVDFVLFLASLHHEGRFPKEDQAIYALDAWPGGRPRTSSARRSSAGSASRRGRTRSPGWGGSTRASSHRS